jgi:hypothetical protein
VETLGRECADAAAERVLGRAAPEHPPLALDLPRDEERAAGRGQAMHHVLSSASRLVIMCSPTQATSKRIGHYAAYNVSRASTRGTSCRTPSHIQVAVRKIRYWLLSIAVQVVTQDVKAVYAHVLRRYAAVAADAGLRSFVQGSGIVLHQEVVDINDEAEQAVTRMRWGRKNDSNAYCCNNTQYIPWQAAALSMHSVTKVPGCQRGQRPTVISRTATARC